MTIPITIPASTSGAKAIDVAWRCVREGGAIALDRFRGERTVDTKGRGNVVTDADVAVELRIKEILAAEFPAHAILSEETSAETDPNTGWVWVIDPIDGTKNYSVGIPVWCVNIALCFDGDPVVGITYDAVHDEGFWAVAGGGAWLGEQRLRASSSPDVDSSVIGVDLGYDDARGSGQIALMARIFPRVQSIRILGSAALAMAYASCGRLDLFTHMNVAPWDVAAGILLVREAGGAASDRRGGPMRVTSFSFAAGGRAVHDDFMARYSEEGERMEA
jgi:fructose-1,6-bisphosphatase/inositol monophosphatase family enzyme